MDLVPRTTQGSPEHYRIGRWILVSSILASGMAFIDATALSVALPALQAEYSATSADLLWINNGFSLPLAALLLLGGGLGDAFGRKRVFVFGIIIFAAASLACGCASGTQSLIAARVVQGLGAALMIPGSLALVSTFFATEKRGKAIGTWSAFSVIATAIGPVLGGLLARVGLWRWVFFINLPLAAFALTALAVKIPELNHPRENARLDYKGALFVALGLAGINYGLIALPAAGGANLFVLGSIGCGLLSLLLFVFVESRTENPLLPLSLFKSKMLIAASLLGLLVYTAFHAVLFFLPLNLIQVQAYDPALAGATQLPLMIFLLVLSRPAGSLVDRRGPRLPLTIGPAAAGLGFLLLSWPGITGGPQTFCVTFLPGLLVLGAGLGVTMAPLSATVMASVCSSRQGLASGINSTVSRLSAVLAIALVGPLAAIAFEQSLIHRVRPLGLAAHAMAQLVVESSRLADARVPSGLSAETARALSASIKLAFVDAFRVVAGVAAGLSWVGALVGAWSFRRLRPSGVAEGLH